MPQPVAPPGDSGWSDEEEPEPEAPPAATSAAASEAEEEEEEEEDWEEEEEASSDDEDEVTEEEEEEDAPPAPLLFSLRVDLGRGRSERRAPDAPARAAAHGATPRCCIARRVATQRTAARELTLLPPRLLYAQP